MDRNKTTKKSGKLLRNTGCKRHRCTWIVPLTAVLIGYLLLTISGCGTIEKSSESVEPVKGIFAFKRAVEQAAFTDFEGDTVSVTDFKGKVIMIDFWETWCKPCTNSFPGLNKLQEKYSDDFVVLAVTPGFADDADDARDFAEDHDYRFTYLLDSGNVHKRLGIDRIPYKLFLDPKGQFTGSSIGSEGPEHDYEKIMKIIEREL